MERWLDLVDRFRTPVTIVLVVAILTAGGVLLTRSYQLQSVIEQQSSVDAESNELAKLRERQQALLGELEKLRAQAVPAEAASNDSGATQAVPGSATQGTAAPESSGIVHLNTADQVALETLPGIGASKAQAILAYRSTNGRFKSIDELDNVKGIGPSTVAKLKPHLTLD